MSDISEAISFAGRLYLGRARTLYGGYVRRHPILRLETRAGMRDPYPIYREIRAAGTLNPTPRGNWVTAHHHLADAVLRDRRFGVVAPGTTGPVEGTGEGANLSFLDMNPPDHTRLRRLAQPSFSPKVIAGYQGLVERTVSGMLDRAASAGSFDLVPALAAPLPIAVITELLGIPDANAEEFAEYGATLGSALDGIRSLRHAARLNTANARVVRLFQDLIELRRREPRDDIISRLAAAEGEQVAAEEIVPMCGLLLLAGYETTVNLIGNCVHALLEHREQWEALCADPETMAPKAVQEALRYDPPVQTTGRFALEDVELAGRQVRAGRFVITLLGAAGRDPAVYERPDEFDVCRETAVEHLAFSSGIHYCLGRPLALLEMNIAIRMLAQRMPGLRPAGRPRRMRTATLRGLTSLPVSGGMRASRP